LHRAVFLFGGLRRHRASLILDGDVRHGVDELPQEVDLRTLHQARHHDGEADAHGHASHADQGLPHPGTDMGPSDVEDKLHGGYRLRRLRRASLTTESTWAEIAAEITASSGSVGVAAVTSVTALTTVGSG